MYAQQIPWDFPVGPIYSYTENNPPVVPNVVVDPSLVPYIPLVTAIVANIAGQYAQATPVRMFCYNTLAINNWQNHAIPAVVKLVCDMTILKQQRGELYNLDIAALEGITDEVLTCYASALAFNNNQLMNQLPPQLAQAVTNNYRSYNDLVSMTSGGQRQSMQTGRMPMMGQQRMQLPTGHGHPALAGNARGGVDVTGHKFAQGRRDRPLTVTGQRSNTGVQIAGMVHQASNEQALRPNLPGISIPPAPSKQPVAEPTPAPEPIKNIVAGEKYMDRNMHRIAYHDQFFPNSLSPRNKKAENLEKAITDFPLLNPKDGDDFDLVYVCDLEVAIQDIHAHHSGSVGADITISAHYVNVTNPIISPIEIRPIFDKLKEVFVFDQMAKLIRSTIVNGTPDDVVSRKKQLMWAGQVDRVMTDLMNSWLHLAFPSHKEKMDSFIYDADDISSYVVNTHGGNAVTSLIMLQKSTMACISENIRKSDGEDMDILADGHITRMTADGAVDVNQITIPYAVYYISELAETLNYRVGKEPAEVTEEATPQLYRMLKMLSGLQKYRNIARHILLTADNCRYEFCPSAVDPSVYYIAEL